MLKIKNKIPSALTIGGKIVERIKMRNEVVWGRVQTPLYIQNTYNGSNTVTIKQTLSGSPDSSTYAKHLQYSKNGLNWTTITLSSTAYTITLNKGEKVYFRGNEGVFNYWYSRGAKKAITTISANQTHTVGGNINTLLDYQDPYGLTLPQGAFNSIFENNTKLTSASDITFSPSVDGSLPAFCYLYLFKKCTNLTTVPKSVPAKKQGQDSCNGMFSYTAITTAPALPATILGNSCYVDTFHGCSKLVNPPELPATTLKTNCYRALFARCTSLVNAPELPATTLADGCYRELFYGCTSLINPPELPAETLTTSCYQQLFYGCSKLNNITVYADDISATNCTSNWLSGVASTGTFNNYGGARYTANSASGIPTGWTQNYDYTNYFYIHNKTSNSTNFEVRTSIYNTTSDNYAKSLQYSKDKKTWTTITFQDNIGDLIALYPGEKVYFRNDSGYFNWCEYDNMGYAYTQFDCYENYAVGGNVMSLIDYNNMDTAQLSDGCFSKLFYESYHLTDASKLILPYKTAPNCFKQMFYNCSKLTKAPELPATEMAEGCYKELFYGCTSLVNAPELPARALSYECYRELFYGCSKINSLTVYAESNSAYNCTTDWLSGVASSGTFYNMSFAPFENGASGIPNGWTEVLPPVQSITAQPDTFTIKSFETSVKCTSILTIKTPTGNMFMSTNTATITVGENTGDSTRTLTETLNYRGIPYEVTIIQTANDPTK